MGGEFCVALLARSDLDMSVVPDMTNLAPVYYNLLLVGGQICLPILILILCISKRVKRHPTIINFLVTWIIYSIIYCLLYVFTDCELIL